LRQHYQTGKIDEERQLTTMKEIHSDLVQKRFLKKLSKSTLPKAQQRLLKPNTSDVQYLDQDIDLS
jgi:hypothetical protein